MSTHGGTREGAGRKPKSDEIKLIEALSPLDEVAFAKLKEGVESGSFYHLKLLFYYIN